MTRKEAPTKRRTDSRDGLLKTIAVFKLTKALLLAGIGFGFLELINPETAHQAERWVTGFAWRLGHPAIPAVQAGLAHLQASRLPMVGAVAFLYAALFAVEGMGLWRARPWAEYLTIIATTSFVPFEVYELVQRVTWSRGVTLLVNLLVLAYLILNVRRRASGKRAGPNGRRSRVHLGKPLPISRGNG